MPRQQRVNVFLRLGQLSTLRAIETKTMKVKPRTVSLADFNKTQARDDKLLRTSEAYANVILENSREEREVEIKANKEIQKKYMNMVNL